MAVTQSATPPRLSAYERGVHATFPDAPRGVFVPSGAARTKMELNAAVWATRWQFLAPLFVLVVVAWIVIASKISERASFAEPVGGLTCFFFATWVAQYRAEQKRDRDVFFRQYAKARGLQVQSDAQLGARVPLARMGDRRTCQHVVHGSMGGVAASLANYTYTVTAKIGRDRDVDHNFLVLHAKLPQAVARRYRAVHLRARSGVSHPRALTGTRAVRFESHEFEQRYEVRVTQTQDDVALYELFSTSFIDALTRGPVIMWQQVSDDLVFYRSGHCDTTMQLDRFVMDVQFVIQRYLEEWQ